MNLLLIDCKKDKDNSYRHTVFKFGKLNGKPTKEILIDKWLSAIVSPEWVEQLRINPKEVLSG